MKLDIWNLTFFELREKFKAVFSYTHSSLYICFISINADNHNCIVYIVSCIWYCCRALFIILQNTYLPAGKAIYKILKKIYVPGYITDSFSSGILKISIASFFVAFEIHKILSHSFLTQYNRLFCAATIFGEISNFLRLNSDLLWVSSGYVYTMRS